MNAVWYVLWTGCQWKALHRSWFGVSASTAHARFQSWQKLGVFRKALKRMIKYYDKKRDIKWKWQAIDSKSVSSPLGGEDAGRNPTDRGKLGSKIHLLVDERGAPLSVFVTGANRHDKVAAVDVISSVPYRPERKQHLCADAAYDSGDIHAFVVGRGYTDHIKPNRRRGDAQYCLGLGEVGHPPRRWVIERTLSWLTKRRSLRTRWAKLVKNWVALIEFACAHILLQMARS